MCGTCGGTNINPDSPYQIAVIAWVPPYSRFKDAERLAKNPAMQAVAGRRALEKQAASTNTVGRFDPGRNNKVTDQGGTDAVSELATLPTGGAERSGCSAVGCGVLR